MKFKKAFAVIFALSVMSFGLTGCFEEDETISDSENVSESESTNETNNASDTNTENTPSKVTRKSTTMAVSDNGLNINRPQRSQSTPMGDEGWTIFVYLCGTDLESNNGMGTMDLEEMQSASTGENVRFVVETGGTNTWTNDVSSDMLQRYIISDGNMELVDEIQLDGMGKASTLTDFLSWGVENYAANNMGLVFWNHGGGSVTGVCFDETNDYDSLSLKEIDEALLNVYDQMTDNFEFIGFDACLMGTIESANILASYADYMYGSEELEPGYGWDYLKIGNYLGNNINADGEQLGKVVADSFYESCADIGEEASATFSIIDLSKIDALVSTFYDFSKSLYSVTDDESVLGQVVRSAVAADNFGGNNKSEGYTNMVDLAGVVNAGGSYAEGFEDTLSAIEAAVIYTRNGANHTDACGLSCYYPLQIQGSEELKTFGDIAVSPYYLSFVDRAAYCAVNGGSSDGYDDTGITDIWGFTDDLTDDGSEYHDDSESEAEYENEHEDDYWSYYEEYEQTGESPLISFESEPAIDEDGYYGFVLTEDALNMTASVQANVYTFSADGNDLIELGISVDIIPDWESGAFYDNFDGYWFSLPDGQNLAVYVVGEYDGYDIYTSPVYVNGEQTNLRITHDYQNGEITIDGIWDGIDEYGMADREITKLSEGDEIVPLFYAFDIETEEEYTYYGETYVFDGTPEIYFDYLYDGDFLYGFYIDDVYGDYYETDYVNFTVDGGKVYYFNE